MRLLGLVDASDREAARPITISVEAALEFLEPMKTLQISLRV